MPGRKISTEEIGYRYNVIGLVNDMIKYKYEYKDILDWSYKHEFPSDYPLPRFNN